MKEKAKGLDTELAEVDPSSLTNSMRMGVGPAMVGDTMLNYWGTKPDGNWGNETKHDVGVLRKKAE